jgi:hypothetical protein
MLVLVAMVGCQKKDFKVPNQFVTEASEEGFNYFSDNLDIGMFHFDLSGHDVLSIFEIDFDDIVYNGLIGRLLLNFTITDGDYANSRYYYELYNENLDYKRTQGSFRIGEESDNVSLSIDSVNSGDLWSFTMFKATDSTDEVVRKVAGFFFKIHHFDERIKIKVIEERNTQYTWETLRTSMHVRFTFESQNPIRDARIVVVNEATGDTVFDSVFANTVPEDGNLMFLVALSQLTPNTSYSWYVYITASDGVIDYERIPLSKLTYKTYRGSDSFRL